MTASLWRNGGFMRLWASQAVSTFGSQFTIFVVPSLAILVLHASAFDVGVLVALNRIAYPLLGLPAGVWVDRLRRRPVMIACNLAQALILLAIPVAYLAGGLNLAVLYVTTTLAGVAAMIFNIAYVAFLPELIPADQLMAGNSRLISTDTAAQIAGPGLAGFLAQALEPALLVLADVASFVFAAVMLVFVRGAHEPSRQPAPAGGRPAASPAPPRHFRAEVSDGLRFVFRHPLLRPITAYTALANIGNAIIQSVFLVFAYRVAHLTPAVAGILLGCGSAGALLGTFLARPLQRRFGLGPTLVGSSLVGTIGRFLLVITAAGLSAPLIGLSWLSFGVSLSIFNINRTTITQAAVPAQLRGRAGAATSMVIWGTIPLGALIGGSLAQTIGPVLAILVACIIRVAGTPVLLRRAVTSVRDVSDLIPLQTEGAPV
jgi:Na+/melibiose symporter-like transporter